MWTVKGLGRGVLTTPYPRRPETSPGVSPGRPSSTPGTGAAARLCPTGALVPADGGLDVRLDRCIACQRCRTGDEGIRWEDDTAWAVRASDRPLPGPEYRHSLHVRIVDAGDCGACLHEVRQLTGPYYAMHRLGIFVTPTPRAADVLMVVGAVTRAMERALVQTYEAMPGPKWVMAVGSEAATGVPYAPSFAVPGGVGEILPVDIVVPGAPPPPLAILDGLLTLIARRPPTPAKAEVSPWSSS